MNADNVIKRYFSKYNPVYEAIYYIERMDWILKESLIKIYICKRISLYFFLCNLLMLTFIFPSQLLTPTVHSPVFSFNTSAFFRTILSTNTGFPVQTFPSVILKLKFNAILLKISQQKLVCHFFWLKKYIF